jgi:leader peptidase (prepilin peptidase)/N-methyltransferase
MELIGYLLAAFIGLAIGWGINYLADVLPVYRKLVYPVCSVCGVKDTAGQILLFQACPSCGNRAVFRKWLVMAGALGASLLFWAYPTVRLGYWAGLFLLGYFGLIFVIDMEHRLILHPVSLFGMVIGVTIGIWLHGIWNTLLGGVAGFGIMFGLYYLGDLFARFIARLRGTHLDEVALGFGDVMLSGVLGFVLGWPGISAGLILAILFGGAASLIYILVRVFQRSYQPFIAIPYAPFLLLGAIVLLFRY